MIEFKPNRVSLAKPANPELLQSIDADKSKLVFPKDHYAHIDAATEWWWHIGTLTAETPNGTRTFGFEINAAGFPVYTQDKPFSFTQIMLTDVAKQKHFKHSQVYTYTKDWAQADVSKPWGAALGKINEDNYAVMTASASDPTDMHVQAKFMDIDSKTTVVFDFKLKQTGDPFLVWGTGVLDLGGGKYNFYYSLPNLQASGTISINEEVFQVTGITWMDHQWGFFGSSEKPASWGLQDIQFDYPGSPGIPEGRVNISNQHYASNPLMNNATVQMADGTNHLVWLTSANQLGSRVYQDDQGNKYPLDWEVTIPSWGTFFVMTLFPDQVFPPLVEGGNPVYEGVAIVKGTFLGQAVSGTAWNELTPGE